MAVDTDPDPKVFETTISAQPATVDMNIGRPVHALTFNGSVPGATITVNVGDTVVVHYENHLDKPSGIHWHGVEVPNAMDGTPLTQNMVKPGGTFLYRFKVSRPGIFWYHPHHHSSNDQVFKGLYGALIVRDPAENKLNAPGHPATGVADDHDGLERHDGVQGTRVQRRRHLQPAAAARERQRPAGAARAHAEGSVRDDAGRRGRHASKAAGESTSSWTGGRAPSGHPSRSRCRRPTSSCRCCAHPAGRSPVVVTVFYISEGEARVDRLFLSATRGRATRRACAASSRSTLAEQAHNPA